jgi:hypothetical protein
MATGIGVAARQQAPADWKWRTDVPATLGAGDKVGAGSWHFVSMPPGWHVTTGPGALLYPAAAHTLRDNFRLEAEIFLFPGTTQNEYGIFVGGTGLDGSAPAYAAFVVRRDGQAAILRRTPTGFTPVVDWMTSDAVVPHPGGTSGTAKNVLGIDAGPTEITFTANGKPIAKIARTAVPVEGVFGFRVGADVNLHVSTLDVTHRLAPPAIRK